MSDTGESSLPGGALQPLFLDESLLNGSNMSFLDDPQEPSDFQYDSLENTFDSHGPGTLAFQELPQMDGDVFSTQEPAADHSMAWEDFLGSAPSMSLDNEGQEQMAGDFSDHTPPAPMDASNVNPQDLILPIPSTNNLTPSDQMMLGQEHIVNTHQQPAANTNQALQLPQANAQAKPTQMGMHQAFMELGKKKAPVQNHSSSQMVTQTAPGTMAQGQVGNQLGSHNLVPFNSAALNNPALLQQHIPLFAIPKPVIGKKPKKQAPKKKAKPQAQAQVQAQVQAQTPTPKPQFVQKNAASPPSAMPRPATATPIPAPGGSAQAAPTAGNPKSTLLAVSEGYIMHGVPTPEAWTAQRIHDKPVDLDKIYCNARSRTSSEKTSLPLSSTEFLAVHDHALRIMFKRGNTSTVFHLIHALHEEFRQKHTILGFKLAPEASNGLFPMERVKATLSRYCSLDINAEPAVQAGVYRDQLTKQFKDIYTLAESSEPTQTTPNFQAPAANYSPAQPHPKRVERGKKKIEEYTLSSEQAPRVLDTTTDFKTSYYCSDGTWRILTPAKLAEVMERTKRKQQEEAVASQFGLANNPTEQQLQSSPAKTRKRKASSSDGQPASKQPRTSSMSPSSQPNGAVSMVNSPYAQQPVQPVPPVQPMQYAPMQPQQFRQQTNGFQSLGFQKNAYVPLNPAQMSMAAITAGAQHQQPQHGQQYMQHQMTPMNGHNNGYAQYHMLQSQMAQNQSQTQQSQMPQMQMQPRQMQPQQMQQPANTYHPGPQAQVQQFHPQQHLNFSTPAQYAAQIKRTGSAMSAAGFSMISPVSMQQSSPSPTAEGQGSAKKSPKTAMSQVIDLTEEREVAEMAPSMSPAAGVMATPATETPTAAPEAVQSQSEGPIQESVEERLKYLTQEPVEEPAEEPVEEKVVDAVTVRCRQLQMVEPGLPNSLIVEFMKPSENSIYPVVRDAAKQGNFEDLSELLLLPEHRSEAMRIWDARDLERLNLTDKDRPEWDASARRAEKKRLRSQEQLEQFYANGEQQRKAQDGQDVAVVVEEDELHAALMEDLEKAMREHAEKEGNTD
ncbi:hypothetical protein B0I35DRAFT_411879 [Stachybotrys elegans]|uniref:Uncharacterized protein n=1 Tax=Stachybotrys elegans TaxID=80388 RepID=A0A8K0WNT0_9HYPO|nr:hypothetical protein B0I35DRAFT_411879 [Stachybotrys elegans]